MNDDKLIEFLERRISELKRLEALTDAVRDVSNVNALGSTYQMLIESLNQAWGEVENTRRVSNRYSKSDPAGRADSRLGWFNSVYNALQKSHSRPRPPVNSRKLNDIRSAAYVIRIHLSRCRHDLEQRLSEERRLPLGA